MRTDSITIVGGGSAGWMTAATLIRLFPKKKITLIESANTPIVGVGESTLGQINHWLNLLGIKDKDFMKDCDASYKLSIKFNNFYMKRSGGFHYPFGDPLLAGLPGGVNTWWLKKYMFPQKTGYADYARFLYPGMALVEQNKFGPNVNGDLGNFNLETDSAYHFDAIKFGQTLKNNICIPEGVVHIIDDIKNSQKDVNGNIVSLNNKYFADMFIDCTGFQSLLLGHMMGVKFNSYNDLLPNDRAIATRIPYTDKEKELEPFTTCTAIENGWVWRIPSWERIGTGYVYSSKYVSDEQALKEFQGSVQHETAFDMKQHDLDYKYIKMRIGIHDEIFHKNVVAIGLSAGFIEPLESNGLFTVHQFLLYLARILHKEDLNQFDKDGYNLKCTNEFNTFAEFVAMHYYLSQRDDTPYWKDLTSKSVEKLKKKDWGDIDLLLRLKMDNEFSDTLGLHCVATGLHQSPIDPTEICLRNKVTNYEEWFNQHAKTACSARDLMVQGWKHSAKKKPKLIDVLTEIHAGS